MVKIAAIIPSRYHSTRFEGKPLALINGIPMIQRVYKQVETAGRFTSPDIIVATDDQRIASAVQSFGGNVVMTSDQHRSGSERLWEVMEKPQNRHFHAAINIQGDEPAVPGKLVAQLYDELQTGHNPVVTPVYYNTSYDDYLSRHVVKVVFDRNFHALYFSRSPIPFMDREHFDGFYQHIGMYGYLREALGRFVSLPGSKLENMEKLEQLRFLENDIKIKVIISKYRSVGVDVPGDIARVEELLNKKENESV
jgi:3-deoxy-manno-octulosonate cytidylyltransferase (CMP-KDO synthetase)